MIMGYWENDIKQAMCISEDMIIDITVLGNSVPY